jgi:nucleoside-diphosphate-sugar epimerase
MTPRIRALVTGSDGFIGSRLVGRLLRDGIDVCALVRRGLVAKRSPNGDRRASDAALLERHRGDVCDRRAVERAAEDCDVVFHCAWGGASLQDARLINVEGTRHVIEAAARAGIRRVVHLSSMAVHGYRFPETLTEDFPLTTGGDAYSISKAEGEKVAFATGAATGVEVVALRPSLVYGPRSPFWLISYFERTKNEQITLIDDGSGLANLVWVDDVVEAMLIAWQRPSAAGEAFLISGAHPVTWREYIGRFARMCGKPLPPSVPAWRAKLEAPWRRVWGTLTQRPRGLSGMDLTLMPNRTTVSIEKAKRDLAYAPAFSFDDGMQACEAWLRQQGYLPPLAASA